MLLLVEKWKGLWLDEIKCSECLVCNDSNKNFCDTVETDNTAICYHFFHNSLFSFSIEIIKFSFMRVSFFNKISQRFLKLASILRVLTVS